MTTGDSMQNNESKVEIQCTTPPGEGAPYVPVPGEDTNQLGTVPSYNPAWLNSLTVTNVIKFAQHKNFILSFFVMKLLYLYVIIGALHDHSDTLLNVFIWPTVPFAGLIFIADLAEIDRFIGAHYKPHKFRPNNIFFGQK